MVYSRWSFFFFQAEDGIRDLVRSRGLGDVYKRQVMYTDSVPLLATGKVDFRGAKTLAETLINERDGSCLLYSSDAADERSSVDLGGRRIIKKKKHT